MEHTTAEPYRLQLPRSIGRSTRLVDRRRADRFHAAASETVSCGFRFIHPSTNSSSPVSAADVDCGFVEAAASRVRWPRRRAGVPSVRTTFDAGSVHRLRARP
jgi:hypothetical protein